jgi:hypothetical protein
LSAILRPRGPSILLSLCFLLSLGPCVAASDAVPNESAAASVASQSTSPVSTAGVSEPAQGQKNISNNAQKIALLQKFYEKRLVGIADLDGVFPNAWLVADANLEADKKIYEEQLQLAMEKLAKDPEAKDEKQNIALLQLSLQWLNLSPPQRQQLIAEAESKYVIAQNEVQAQENLATARSAVIAQAENTKEIKLALSQSDDDRERKLLSIRLDIENHFTQLNQYRNHLGEVQQRFIESLKQWKVVSSDISEQIEDEGFAPGSQNFASSRTKLRELLHQSNSVVASRQDFEENYFNASRASDLNIEIPNIQVRETDSESIRNLVHEIQQQRIGLQAAIDLYQRDRAQLTLDIINWQFTYRHGLVDLRSELIARVIHDYAFVLNNAEPVLIELETVSASIGFWWWKNTYIHDNADKIARKQFRFNAFTHVLKLLLLLGFIGWLFARRHHLLQSTRVWMLRRASGANQTRVVRSMFTIFQDLYIFFVLLFLGKIAIEFSASVGFESARHLSPLLNHIILFFLLTGLVNYISPFLSQRNMRGQKYASDVAALETVFTSIPKIYLYYWLVAGIVSIVLTGYLGVNLIHYYLANFFGLIALGALFVSVWRNREVWRRVNDKANTSAGWNRLSEVSRDKIWEPVVLVLGGGLGVYRLAWRILTARLAELEMTRSFQAMLSRAILERQHRRSAAQLNSARFPDDYWRAFDFRVPAEPDWYVSRSEAEAQLNKAYAEWQDAKTATRILISGDRGIGKSELIAQFVRSHKLNYFHSRIHTGDSSVAEVCVRISQEFFGDDAAKDADTLIARINASPPSVIALENIENALLRSVGGFDTFSFVVDLVLRCSIKHMWITTVTRYAWAIARQGVVGANCFSDVIDLGGLSEDQLKTLILTRHNELHNVSPDFSPLHIRSKNSKQTEPAELVEKKARNLYFRILWDYTRGNPRQALYYWKASLIWSDTDTQVKLFDVPEQRVLENLQDTTLMMLAALIEHNGLTLKGLIRVMNSTENFVVRRLEELTPHGIVFLFNDGERAGWHVESFWTRAVENYLVKRQLLFCGDHL